MQLDAVGELVRATRERGVTGQAHGRFAGRHGCFGAELGEETGLAQKGFASAKLFRIDELQKHRGAPARFAVGAAMTAKRVGERFNEQAQGKTFVAQIRSAQRQDGPAAMVEEHLRIVRRSSGAVHEPRPGQTFARRRPSLTKTVRGRGRADVNEDGLATGWNADGERVGTVTRRCAAVRRHGAGLRVGAGQPNEAARFGDRFEVSLKTADVMAAPDDDGHDRMFGQTFLGRVNRAPHEPRAGQVTSVPGECRAVVRDDHRLAAFFHRAVRKRFEVIGEQGEAVGGVSEQVALQQHVRHVAGALVRESGSNEEHLPRLREIAGELGSESKTSARAGHSPRSRNGSRMRSEQVLLALPDAEAIPRPRRFALLKRSNGWGFL